MKIKIKCGMKNSKVGKLHALGGGGGGGQQRLDKNWTVLSSPCTYNVSARETRQAKSGRARTKSDHVEARSFANIGITFLPSVCKILLLKSTCMKLTLHCAD